jgi:hypothetical protein
MKYRVTALAVVLCSGGLLLAGSNSGAAAATAFTCAGTVGSPKPIPAGTYSTLSMPENTGCTINGAVSVLAPLTVGQGAALALKLGASLHVQGGLTVETGGVFAVPHNSIPVTIQGTVVVNNDAVLVVGIEHKLAPINSSIGAVYGNAASSVQIHNTKVNGSVNLQNGGAVNAILGGGNNFNDLEDNNIIGGVTIEGYEGVWAGVLRDRIQGPFTFSNNDETVVDEYDIGSNTIFGGATCNSNNPAPNMGGSPGKPSVVHGPTTGNQKATCTGV